MVNWSITYGAVIDPHELMRRPVCKKVETRTKSRVDTPPIRDTPGDRQNPEVRQTGKLRENHRFNCPQTREE